MRCVLSGECDILDLQRLIQHISVNSSVPSSQSRWCLRSDLGPLLSVYTMCLSIFGGGESEPSRPMEPRNEHFDRCWTARLSFGWRPGAALQAPRIGSMSSVHWDLQMSQVGRSLLARPWQARAPRQQRLTLACLKTIKKTITEGTTESL